MEQTNQQRSHRSVRRYASKAIPDDVLLDIVEAARWTGSAKNVQPWEIVVVRDPSALQELSRRGPYAEHVAGAAALIVLVMGDARWAFDCGRLAERVQLAAWAHGVGSCIATIMPDENEAAVKAMLDIPAERWVRQSVALGYPADARAHRFSAEPDTGKRGLSLGRKPLDEFASWERYGRKRA
jgi:nitroreductase